MTAKKSEAMMEIQGKDNERNPREGDRGSYGRYIGLGLALGLAIGSGTENLGLWLPLGLLFGWMLGRWKKRKRTGNPDDSGVQGG